MSADENAGDSEAGSGSGFFVDDGYLSQVGKYDSPVQTASTEGLSM